MSWLKGLSESRYNLLVYFKRKGNRNHRYHEILSHLTIKPPGGRHHNKHSTRAEIILSLYIKCSNIQYLSSSHLSLILCLSSCVTEQCLCLALTRSTHYLLRLQIFNAHWQAHARHLKSHLRKSQAPFLIILSQNYYFLVTFSCQLDHSIKSQIPTWWKRWKHSDLLSVIISINRYQHFT